MKGDRKVALCLTTMVFRLLKKIIKKQIETNISGYKKLRRETGVQSVEVICNKYIGFLKNSQQHLGQETWGG